MRFFRLNLSRNEDPIQQIEIFFPACPDIFHTRSARLAKGLQLGGMKSSQTLPEVFFFQDDGFVPNSKYPLIIYRRAFERLKEEGADWLEKKFNDNDWSNSWRNGMYSYHHFHSTSHEVLGVYDGSAQIQVGGAVGRKVYINAGDILVIPAGVAHMKIEDDGLAMVGAYAAGREWDVLKGAPGERPQADLNIASVPFPSHDPLLGKNGGLMEIWSNKHLALT
jgi:uncharacterized protein YjlB